METSNTTEVNELIQRVKSNIARRKQELEKDEKSRRVVEDRMLTENLSNVNGIQSNLNRMRTARLKAEQEVTQDPYSHGYKTKGQLRRD